MYVLFLIFNKILELYVAMLSLWDRLDLRMFAFFIDIYFTRAQLITMILHPLILQTQLYA